MKRNPHSSIVHAAVTLTVILGPNPLLAQDNSDSAIVTKSKEKRDTYAEAVRAAEQKDLHKARSLFLSLWRDVQTYDVAYALSKLEHDAGNYPAAAQYVARALQLVPPVEKEDLRQQMEVALEKVKSRVATIKILSNRPDANITINGKPIPDYALQSEVYLAPGKHTIRARHNEFNAKETIETSAGDVQTITLELKPPKPEPEPAPTPQPESNPPPPVDTGTDGGKSMLPVYIGGGVAALGLAGGIGFTLRASDAEDEVRRHDKQFADDACLTGIASSAECSAAKDARDSAQTNADFANAGWAVFGVGALATVGYLLFWPESSDASEARLQPTLTLGHTGGSLHISGNF